MKLVIVRHGDPDYTIDSLTEKGWKEAGYLAERLEKLDVKEFYVSPLGRAKDTASCTLKRWEEQPLKRSGSGSLPPELTVRTEQIRKRFPGTGCPRTG